MEELSKRFAKEPPSDKDEQVAQKIAKADIDGLLEGSDASLDNEKAVTSTTPITWKKSCKNKASYATLMAGDYILKKFEGYSKSITATLGTANPSSQSLLEIQESSGKIRKSHAHIHVRGKARPVNAISIDRSEKKYYLGEDMIYRISSFLTISDIYLYSPDISSHQEVLLKF